MFNIAPDLLERDFHAPAPHQRWAGDISSIWAREGWLYLALAIGLGPMADNGSLLELHSRRVIGWVVSNRMKRDLAIRALRMAIALRAQPNGCIFHSDRAVDSVRMTTKRSCESMASRRQ